MVCHIKSRKSGRQIPLHLVHHHAWIGISAPSRRGNLPHPDHEAEADGELSIDAFLAPESRTPRTDGCSGCLRLCNGSCWPFFKDLSDVLYSENGVLASEF